MMRTASTEMTVRICEPITGMLPSCGNADTIAALGAGSGVELPGYGVAPTLYLVSPAGKIVWSDEQARFHHAESAQWRQEIERAIETALTRDSALPP